MNAFWPIVLPLVSRYMHLVCATLLVGGTLFYEMVVPVAIEELKPEQQLVIFARARWVFKWIVWISVVILAASGIVSSWANWPQYETENIYAVRSPANVPPALTKQIDEIPPWGRPGWWWAAHASSGLIALLIAVGLMIGNVPPSQPIRWMRFNLVILLVVVFLGTAARLARINPQQTSTDKSATPVETQGP